MIFEEKPSSQSAIHCNPTLHQTSHRLLTCQSQAKIRQACLDFASREPSSSGSAFNASEAAVQLGVYSGPVQASASLRVEAAAETVRTEPVPLARGIPRLSMSPGSHVLLNHGL